MQSLKIDGWLFIDKPIGISSFSIIRKIRKLINIKKIGHAGTLDPFATGILAIAIGEATKSIDYLNGTKDYEFNITFGESKTTEDLEGDTLDTTTKIPTEKEIKDILKYFIGNIEQYPPKYSSVKIDGVRAYNLARKNLDFKGNIRKTDISDLV
jgi:tRNA pseudouridine55 synthase